MADGWLTAGEFADLLGESRDFAARIIRRGLAAGYPGYRRQGAGIDAPLGITRAEAERQRAALAAHRKAKEKGKP